MTTAWLTGASGAWGGAFATALLAAGYDVLALGREDVPALAARALAVDRRWSFAPLDLSRPTGLEAVLAAGPQPSGEPPDVMIHAAVSHVGDRAALLRADYLAPTALIDTVLERMLSVGRGRVGVLVAQNARLGLAGMGDFSAAQAALWTWCEARQGELGKDRHDVSLTVVIPPRTASETQRFVARRTGHRARLTDADAGGLLDAVLSGKRRAGRRPYLAALAMLVR